MSIYPGTALEQSYAQGFALGSDYADADRRNRYSLASGEEELRAEAGIARRGSSRDWYARKLGIVRGYREEARSLRWGRWGL